MPTDYFALDSEDKMKFRHDALGAANRLKSFIEFVIDGQDFTTKDGKQLIANAEVSAEVVCEFVTMMNAYLKKKSL